jgi:putative DNA methylase
VDAVSEGLADDGVPLHEGGRGARAYAEAISVYLALGVGKLADYHSTLCSWMDGQGKPGHTFVRQALAMTWDFVEGDPLSVSTGGYLRQIDLIARVLEQASVKSGSASVDQHDAKRERTVRNVVIVTDPPYYDNIGYSDLSDYFYVWLRPILADIYPDLFRTMLSPKEDELSAAAERYGGDRARARVSFERGLAEAFVQMREAQHPDYPLSVFYAFKQAESSEEGVASTGWESMLEALIHAGFSITGTWPMRTESSSRLRSLGSNALASSIALICRARAQTAESATRRELAAALRAELPAALHHLQQSNVAPVDLAQAAIGPGMAIFTRFAQVLGADGQRMPVREALALINEILDEVLTQQEGDFDAQTRWAIAWFDQFGFEEGEYGVAETLSKAKNTTVSGLVEAGVVASRKGKVRLLKPDELSADWNPVGVRTSAWERVHHLVRVLEKEGEVGAAALAKDLGERGGAARELAYRLYTLCERRKRAPEALAYNALVQSWPELARLARGGERPLRSKQTRMFDEDEE